MPYRDEKILDWQPRRRPRPYWTIIRGLVWFASLFVIVYLILRI